MAWKRVEKSEEMMRGGRLDIWVDLMVEAAGSLSFASQRARRSFDAIASRALIQPNGEKEISSMNSDNRLNWVLFSVGRAVQGQISAVIAGEAALHPKFS